MNHPLLSLATASRGARKIGITSVCSAHPLVIEAALRLGRERAQSVLIESTCNQVNQDGGYTGMTPVAFRDLVYARAQDVGFDREKIVLGGDHLGPNPWKHLPASLAMEKAESLVAAYAKAGFTKLHLDTSMGAVDDPLRLDDSRVAERAARLAKVAETSAGEGASPLYVIGTEVPPPGGAADETLALEVTQPRSAWRTYTAHREAFSRAGCEAAFERVIALVVQPGVEFGNESVHPFDGRRAEELSGVLERLPGLVFEAHSTDYQSEEALTDLVAKGFAILKVGPWLTYALREALYGLDAVADVLEGMAPRHGFLSVMEEAMLAAPQHWRDHYGGAPSERWRLRHFSLSDRIRYYWSAPPAEAYLRDLLARLRRARDQGRHLSRSLLGQYLGLGAGSWSDREPESIILDHVQGVLKVYARAENR